MRNLIVLSSLILLQACGGDDAAPRDFVRYESPSTSVVSDDYIADTTCTKGDASCNVCATDVQRQFHDAVEGKLNWSTDSWSFDWEQPYEPDNATPKSIFGSEVSSLGALFGESVAIKHVQGFVRTNSEEYPYAGSHSVKDGDLGGIFIVKQSSNGLELASLHQTSNDHPSGVHMLGKYLVYGDGSQLVFKNLDSLNQDDDIQLNIESPKFGGGLGFVRLNDDSYLAITTGPGGEDNLDNKYNQFYNLSFQNEQPNELTLLNDSKVIIPSDWPRQDRYILSENLSVIPECVSGDIYTVNVSGSTDAALINGNGYMRLSKLETQEDKLKLTAINYYQLGQNISSCNFRAAGTVSVDDNNKLEFYCHEHGKDISEIATKYSFEKGVF